MRGLTVTERSVLQHIARPHELAEAPLDIYETLDELLRQRRIVAAEVLDAHERRASVALITESGRLALRCCP